MAALVALAGSPARAPSPDEQRLFDDGMRAFSAGDAPAAEKAWQAGYAVGHDPAFLVHIGEAQEKAGAPAEAVASYRLYLKQVPDASDKADVEQRIARLAPPAPAAPAAATVPAETPGEFGGTPPPRAGAPPGPPSATPAQTAMPRADAEHPVAQESEDSGWNRYNLTAVIATAVTVALLGTAGFFGAAAGSHGDDINRLVRFHDPTTGAPLAYSSVATQYAQAMSEGRRDDRDAKIALVGAAGAAVVAALFFVLDAKLGPAPVVSLTPAGNGLGATGGWAWRF
jgi:hypothetical protein